MSDLVPQLRARRMFFLNGAIWLQGVSSDDLCQAAADEIERLRRDHLRFEYLRRLNVPQFKAIFERALKGEAFDDVIDACIAGCTPNCRNDDHPGCAICMSPD